MKPALHDNRRARISAKRDLVIEAAKAWYVAPHADEAARSWLAACVAELRKVEAKV